MLNLLFRSSFGSACVLSSSILYQRTDSIRTMASASFAANKLANEKSPYLLQHALNPVNWFPWCQEAFDKAKAENKLIFLSVGYSTCHWCHVMERESFENLTIGKYLNDNYVAIKVDREERPDVDRVYMNFIQASVGGGGWPMSVWLTPDLKPLFGGTYFPPDDRYYGQPGFLNTLKKIAEMWKESHTSLKSQGVRFTEALAANAQTAPVDENTTLPSADAGVAKAYKQLLKQFDPRKGGFGKAPKFPQIVYINFLLRMYAMDPDGDDNISSLDMATHTLRMMANGGIHDHISKGFHRYSTDANWHVPHFEKMLYDQGQMAVAYSEAYQITKDESLAAVVRDILEYVSRDLSHPEGGFYSAEDADSYPTDDAAEKREGAFCVWTYQEIQEILKDKVAGDKTVADVFSYHYSVQEQGNVDPYQDPHDELKNVNVLIVNGSVKDTAKHFDLPVQLVQQVLSQAREILFEARKKRPLPHKDTKMITAWNGLMISGFAKAGQVLNNQNFVERARKAVYFTKKYMYDDGYLLRTSYQGDEDGVIQIQQPIKGFLDDYSFLIQGLLDIYECCYDPTLLQWAYELQLKQDDLFWDNEGGGYFMSTAQDNSIIIRIKDDQDAAEPCPNSVSSRNLLRLSYLLDKPDFHEKAEKIFKAFKDRLENFPLALPEMLCGLMLLKSGGLQIIVVGELDSPETAAILTRIHGLFLPNKVLSVYTGSQSFLSDNNYMIRDLTKKDDKTTVYVCKNHQCSLPINTIQELEELLQKY